MPKKHTRANCLNCGELITAKGRRIAGFNLEEVKCRRCGWGLVLRPLIPHWVPCRKGQVLAFLSCREDGGQAIADGQGNWVCATCKAILRQETRS